MSAGSTTDTEGGISPLWESEEVSEHGALTLKWPKHLPYCENHFPFSSLLQKENEHAGKGTKQDFAPTQLRALLLSAQACSNLPKKSDPDLLDQKRSPSNKLKSVFGSTAQEGICLSATGDSQTVVPSSVKRTYSEIERSPEPLEIQAKKSNTDYRRCYEIPEETTRFHSGLTGNFSTFQIDGFMASTEGIELSDERFPKRSSPIAVTKTLFCELEEPAEDVFEDGAKDLSHSSLTSPLAGNSDICRSLSLDSDGSMHETSLTMESHSSLKLRASAPKSGTRYYLTVKRKTQTRPSVNLFHTRPPLWASWVSLPPSSSLGTSWRSVVTAAPLTAPTCPGVSRLSVGSVEGHGLFHVSLSSLGVWCRNTSAEPSQLQQLSLSGRNKFILLIKQSQLREGISCSLVAFS